MINLVTCAGAVRVNAALACAAAMLLAACGGNETGLGPQAVTAAYAYHGQGAATSGVANDTAVIDTAATIAAADAAAVAAAAEAEIQAAQAATTAAVPDGNSAVVADPATPGVSVQAAPQGATQPVAQTPETALLADARPVPQAPDATALAEGEPAAAD